MGDSRGGSGPAFFMNQPHYTMEGVVAFLQANRQQQELEASEWVKEKNELIERIKLLESQCETHESLELDLIRRVKMLEHALMMSREASQRAVSPLPVSTPNGVSSMGGSDSGPRLSGGHVAWSSEDIDLSLPNPILSPTIGPSHPEPTSKVSLEDFLRGEDEEAPVRHWGTLGVLKSHLDVVRSLAFTDDGGMLLTASGDATLKLWAMKALKTATKDKAVAADIEPLMTYRGHDDEVLCCAVGFDYCFSGGFDGVVRVWSTPPATHDLYDSSGGTSIRNLAGTLGGHLDCIWDIAVHPSRRCVFSASSDSTIKMWRISETGEGEFLRDLHADKESRRAAGWCTPVTIQVVQTDPSMLVGGLEGGDGLGVVVSMDIETGETTWMGDTGLEELGLANKITTHPSLPMTSTAHDCGSLCFYDLRMAKPIFVIKAHPAPATSLSCSPSGLELTSCGGDGYMRTWDIRQRSLMHETFLHATKMGDACTCVAYHPTQPLVACGGADGRVHVLRHTV